jgi:hypothetical protein
MSKSSGNRLVVDNPKTNAVSPLLPSGLGAVKQHRRITIIFPSTKSGARAVIAIPAYIFAHIPKRTRDICPTWRVIGFGHSCICLSPRADRGYSTAGYIGISEVTHTAVSHRVLASTPSRVKDTQLGSDAHVYLRCTGNFRYKVGNAQGDIMNLR